MQRVYGMSGTEESTSRMDSSVSLRRHDPRDLGLICVVKKREIRFLSDLKNQPWIFLKKRTLRECMFLLTWKGVKVSRKLRVDMIADYSDCQLIGALI